MPYEAFFVVNITFEPCFTYSMSAELYEVGTGYSCNCECRFCNIDDISEKRGHLRPLDDVKSELEGVRKRGVERVAFMGGETTLRSDLPGIISYSKDLGFRQVLIETNGTKLHSESLCNELVDAGADLFLVSFQASEPEKHDFLMGQEGTFEKVVEGLKNLVDLPVDVQTQTVIMSHNYRVMPGITRMLSEIAVQQVNFISLMPEGKAARNYENLAVRHSKAKPYLQEAVDQLDGPGVQIKDMPPCVLEERYREYLALDMTRLDYSDGEVRIEEEDMRNGRKEKIEDCKTCKYFNLCRGLWNSYVEEFGTSEIEPV